jgi:cellulose biosynthesis protein BcsQ
MAKKIFLGNYKGGVGKTTSTYQIALALEKSRYKVLLIDLDPQSSLSEICLTASKEILSELPDDETLNYVIHSQAKEGNSTFNIETLIKSVQGIDFIPNSLFSEYGGLDTISIDDMDDSIETLLILRNFIEDNDLNSKYDFIFFDCPPSDNIITRMAFLYCDYYIIPTIMNVISVRGVKHYIGIIEKIYKKYCEDNEYTASLFGKEPKLIGIFETMRKGNTNSKMYRDVFDKVYVFETVIRHLKDIAESTGWGDTPGCNDYDRLTDEILKRMKKIEGHMK